MKIKILIDVEKNLSFCAILSNCYWLHAMNGTFRGICPKIVEWTVLAVYLVPMMYPKKSHCLDKFSKQISVNNKVYKDEQVPKWTNIWVSSNNDTFTMITIYSLIWSEIEENKSLTTLRHWMLETRHYHRIYWNKSVSARQWCKIQLDIISPVINTQFMIIHYATQKHPQWNHNNQL